MSNSRPKPESVELLRYKAQTLDLSSVIGQEFFCGKELSLSMLIKPRIISWTRLSVCFLGSFAPTRKPCIVTLRKAFAVKQMSQRNRASGV